MKIQKEKKSICMKIFPAELFIIFKNQHLHPIIRKWLNKFHISYVSTMRHNMVIKKFYRNVKSGGKCF